jgi:hypothetical protein
MMAEDKERTGERGYGNIYTPHAGAMIIHVQRESGLANRTLIFTQRQVRLFRIGAIVLGSLIAFGAVSWFFLAAQAARVPYLTRRVNQLQHDVSRVDTLQHSLNELAARFQQVQHMMGSSSMSPAGSPAASLAGDTLARNKTPTIAPVAAAPVDSVTLPDRWPLPMAGSLLASSSPALEIAVPVGTPVRAAGAGLIVEVADDSALGKLIRIAHRSGYETIYGGASEVRVSKGQHVAAGAVIALSGNAPGTLEPHLHFQMRRHGVAIDASSVIKKGPAHGDLQ